MPHYSPLFSSALLSIEAHSCRQARTQGWSAEQGGDAPCLLLVRRGCFGARGYVEVMADPFTALVYDGRHSYRVNRPADGGDATTRIIPSDGLMEEALGRSAVYVPLTPDVQVKHLRLYAMAKARADPLAMEEAAVEVLHAVAAGSAAFDDIRVPAAARRRIADARAFVAASPDADHRLAEVARIAGCSPYHFARLFKQETGSSLRAYRLKLRLAMALEQLAEGAHDLTTLAMDTGFAHHSHMTSSFRRALGQSPSVVRDLLRSRTFLKARLARAA